MQRPTHSPVFQVRHLRSVASQLLAIDGLQAQVEAVMAEMDRAYTKVASHYDLTCQGCEESCCRTVFFHHTYAEFLLLLEGLATLSDCGRQALYERAVAVQKTLGAPSAGPTAEAPRAMCPINQAGRCALYAYRPMICRLHGIPHLLQRPDGRTVHGPGCHRADRIGDARPSQRLDRTPFYQRMAQLEQGLRGHIEAPIRLHMTLAECLAALGGEVDGSYAPELNKDGPL